jgi:hypothetical protein
MFESFQVMSAFTGAVTFELPSTGVTILKLLQPPSTKLAATNESKHKRRSRIGSSVFPQTAIRNTRATEDTTRAAI